MLSCKESVCLTYPEIKSEQNSGGAHSQHAALHVACDHLEPQSLPVWVARSGQ